MQLKIITAVLLLPLCAVFAVPPGAYDERGNFRAPAVTEQKIYVGAEATATRHFEEGLDHTKGEYSVGYTTLGGSFTAQYHFPDFYFDAGVGLMSLLALTVNNIKIDMSNRSQLHLPFYAHAFYKLDPMFALGTGVTHLTELSAYVDSQKVPNSVYHHIFIDIVMQLTLPLAERLVLTLTPVVGLNLLPGRQNVYSVGDLLHMRLQFNVGVLFRIM